MWQRLAIGFMTVALALSAAVGEAPRETALAQSADLPGLFLAVGDSVAAGVGATTPEAGYVGRAFVDLQLRPTGVTALSNLAVGGETTASLISGGQLDRAVAAISDPANNVRVISLSIGGNDLLGLLWSGPCSVEPNSLACQQVVASSISSFAANYPVILQRLTAALAARGSNGVLFVHTYYNPFSGTGSPYEPAVDRALLGTDGVVDCAAGVANPLAMGLNDLLTCVGAAQGANIVDVHPRFVQQGLALTLIAGSDIHPNDAGHSAIAAALVEAVILPR